VARADAALAECAAAALARARRAAEAGGLHLDMAMLAAEPDEIGLRALALAVSTFRAEADDASFLRLDRIETCHAALVAAVRAARPLRRTLAGCVVTLSASGHLIVTAEGPRRRGRRETLTLPATEPPRSLGMEARRT
jgi:tRNA(Ile)-lysidine synthase